MRVALDVMGGDHAPAAPVEAALRAAADHGVDVVCVGAADLVAEHLRRAGGDLPVVDAPDVVGMDEDPVAALRAKPRASVRVACELVAAGEAAAVVSAGSTGATLTAALLALGRAPGVRRPVVAAAIPVEGGRTVVLADAGGSMDVHPDVVGGYAAMARAYAQVLGAPEPRVGLLNVGHEPGKGHAWAKEAFDVLSATSGFTGNIEPAAVLAGDVDVVVTDGFTGNIFLKTLEAAAVPGDGEADTVASLLGVNGEVLVAHGAASAGDIAAALRRAQQVAVAGLAQRISGQMSQAQERRDDG